MPYSMSIANHNGDRRRRHASSATPMVAGRIVVASSDPRQRMQLQAAMGAEGHHVSEAHSVEDAAQITCPGLHDLLIVDSGQDGIATCGLCRRIRDGSDMGIIVLAGDQSNQARIDALNAGADDYVAGPYVLAELQARVRAILRRVTKTADRQPIVLQDREVDLRSYEIKGPGKQVSHLTPKECLVLQYLLAHTDQPRTTQALAQAIWSRDGKGELEYVRIVIRQLRQKIEPNPGNPRYILTERPAGYRFQMPLTARMSKR